MVTLLFIAHSLLAVCLITLVLVQRGKGAEAGASFGAGASQTLFGSQGSHAFFIKLTAVIMAFFFATSIGLTIVVKNANSSYTERELAPLLQTMEDHASGQEDVLTLPDAESVKNHSLDQTRVPAKDSQKSDQAVEEVQEINQVNPQSAEKDQAGTVNQNP